MNIKKRGVCSVENCYRPHHSKGFCNAHYKRLQRWGDPFFTLPFEETGKYIRLTINGRRIMEHRLVMEEYLSRELLPDEQVHHRNGVKDDNRLANLELWVSSQPKGQRVVDQLVWAREILERYVDDERKLGATAIKKTNRKDSQRSTRIRTRKPQLRSAGSRISRKARKFPARVGG